MDNTNGADPNANNMNRWPSVHGPLPARTPDLLAQTSLTPPVLPPSGPTAFQRRQRREARQRARQERQRRREEAAGHASVREERREQAERDQNANTAWDELKELQEGKFQGTSKRFADALTAWKAAMQGSWQDHAVLSAFEAHTQYAMRASPVEVRRWDIISWFEIPARPDGLADGLATAIARMVAYCHKEAVLKSQHHKAEFLASNTSHGTCKPDAACSMHTEFALEMRARFGWEGQSDDVIDLAAQPYSFAGYPKDITSVAAIYILRANFEARKVRLEHAVKSDRYGFVKPEVRDDEEETGIGEEDWETSIDGQLSAFIDAALAAADRNGIIEAVLSEMEAFTDTMDMKAEADTRATNLAQALAQVQSDMTSYQMVIIIRKGTIDRMYRRLERMNHKLLTHATGLTANDAQASIYDATTYRRTMMQGVDMRGQTVLMPFSELMRAIGEDEMLR